MPNLELLREAYAILDGIPEGRICLRFIAQGNSPHHCGTVACGIGWLGMHPTFRARGLRTHHSDVMFGGQFMGYDTAASRLFEISRSDGFDLFTSLDSRLDPDAYSSDKARLLHRIRMFIAEQQEQQQ